MLNTYEHYTRGILLKENIRISEAIIEIRAIYLDTQLSRSAVHSVGSTLILCPM